MYSLRDYDYTLPKELIAQEPLKERDQSRLMLIDRKEAKITHHYFYDLPAILKPGDVLVINDTKVIPARLMGRRATGGKVEVLILDGTENSTKKRCLLKSRKRLSIGESIFFDEENKAVLLNYLDDKTALMEFQVKGSIEDFLEDKGEPPLPPYIQPPSNERLNFHRERYQTVYSKNRGAVAAPTAGLHFSENLLKELQSMGVSFVSVTLHVGYGTFKPVRSEDIRMHKVDPEPFFISDLAAMEINQAKKEGRRIICVGTTSVRALESSVDPDGKVLPTSWITDLMIIPGYQYRIPSGIITNFHLPKTSLLFLVAAFMGLDLLKKAYEIAIRERYRFYSYGDAMLIL